MGALAVLISVVSLFAGTQLPAAMDGRVADYREPVSGGSFAPKGVPVSDLTNSVHALAILIPNTRMFAFVQFHEESLDILGADYRSLRVGINRIKNDTLWSIGNPKCANLNKAIRGRLTAIFYSNVTLIYVVADHAHAPFGDMHVGSKLLAFYVLSNRDLSDPDHKEQDGEVCDGITDQPEYPSPRVSQETKWFAGAITVTGIGLSITAWFAYERHTRVAVALWGCGALTFVLGLYGLSDILCGNGACQ